MPTLLHVDASPRGDHSISRHLSAAFVEAWKAANPGGTVITRDLTKSALTFVDMEWIGGAYTPPEGHSPEQKQALAISDELVAELLSADEIVLGTPMYNFAVPAVVKAWIDHLVRSGKTFSSGPSGYQGLATGRKATFLIASLGSYEPGSGAEGYNQEGPYLQAIFGFMGIQSKVVLAGGGSAVMFGKMSQEEFLKPIIEEVRAAV
ncbi:MAG TPA: NAD(P)H-dependent oxidoreductase [Acidobacteriaceae bacterium]